MRFFKEQRKKLKIWYNRHQIKHYDFTIISNNCWSTRIYQNYGMGYFTPFANLFIYGEDYIKMLENFSLYNLKLKTFIKKDNSRFIHEVKKENLWDDNYPIGVLKDGTEVHFLHYKNEQDAKDKWTRRLKRINTDRIIFKFSDSSGVTPEHIERFDKLPFENKVCFTAKAYPHLKSVVYMDRFKNQEKVDLEWKYSHHYFDLANIVNKMK